MNEDQTVTLNRSPVLLGGVTDDRAFKATCDVLPGMSIEVEALGQFTSRIES